MMNFFDGITVEDQQKALSQTNSYKSFKIGDNEAVIHDVSFDGWALIIILQNNEGAKLTYKIHDDEKKIGKVAKLRNCFRIPLDDNNIQNWIGKKAIAHCTESKPDSQGKTYINVYYFKPNKEPDGVTAPNENWDIGF